MPGPGGLGRPGPHHPAPGDSDVIDAGDLLAAGALLFRDPLLAAAAQGPLCEETLWDFGPDAPARLAALPAAWPACPSQKLEASGNYILRSGWGREDTWIHFRAGSLGGGHGHADLLHVDVYHGGEAVLTDAGRGTYVDGGLRRALKGPAAHNTFRVDGAGFTCYRGTWEWGPIAQPLPALARFTPLADRLAGGTWGIWPRARRWSGSWSFSSRGCWWGRTSSAPRTDGPTGPSSSSTSARAG